ncbi:MULTISPECIES: hypothetical protein [Methylobacterium]|uniref:hypothetical protein n=1 Tax=Methylobacterium TaxID=407 RepID=UPI0011C9ED7E|nr:MULTISPECIES: hypothetical protein [Methylobacterium]TXN39264.1 hypothetical protein FV228_32720 [Methylobacterium sp. WL18]TXN44291.1 hypothetical protein FV233_15365 [Methylobacterium sp. WL7]
MPRAEGFAVGAALPTEGLEIQVPHRMDLWELFRVVPLSRTMSEAPLPERSPAADARPSPTDMTL